MIDMTRGLVLVISGGIIGVLSLGALLTNTIRFRKQKKKLLEQIEIE